MKKVVLGLFVALMLGCSVSPRPENAVIRGVNYVGVSVSDLNQSTTFYGDAADLHRVADIELSDIPVITKLAGRSGVDGTARLMRSTNAQLLFMQFENPSMAAKTTPRVEVNGPGYSHVCYQVAKETRAYDRFLASGAVHVGERQMIQLNPSRPVDYAYARDADEIMFEVEHVDIAKLNLDTPPKNKYRIRHIAIATPNYNRAVKFYSILLEQKSPRRIGRLFNLSGEKFDKMSGLPDTKLKMAFFQVRNMELEIAEYISHPTELPTGPRPIDALGYNMIVFDVADLEAAREKLIAAGGTVVSEAEPMNGGQVMFGRDLDGNLLGFQMISDDAFVSSQNFKNDGGE